MRETGNLCSHLCPLSETSGVTKCASFHSCLKRRIFYPQWRGDRASQRLQDWRHKNEEFLPELLSAVAYVEYYVLMLHTMYFFRTAWIELVSPFKLEVLLFHSITFILVSYYDNVSIMPSMAPFQHYKFTCSSVCKSIG